VVTAFAVRPTPAARRLLGPELATGAGRALIATLVLAKRAPGLAKPLGRRAAAAQVPESSNGLHIVDTSFIEVCHTAGIAVHVWTVDDEPTINRLLDLGVDGIMTDRPSVLRAVLVGRGQWS
jgi:glycerophosphoryl diester phosphodiesterase